MVTSMNVNKYPKLLRLDEIVFFLTFCGLKERQTDGQTRMEGQKLDFLKWQSFIASALVGVDPGLNFTAMLS